MDVMTGVLFIVIGIFSAAGGVLNWEWFMNHGKARMMSKLLTRNGARGFYVVIGVGMVIFGLVRALSAST